jgi:hypothetical protein
MADINVHYYLQMIPTNSRLKAAARRGSKQPAPHREITWSTITRHR